MNQFPIRINALTKEKLSSEIAKANKKQFGRRITADDVINLALTLVTDHHIKLLQTKSMSNHDRIDMMYAEYTKKNGYVSKDDFLGSILSKFTK
jgi:hypothetical protein